MTIAVTRLTPCFAARIDGVDITRPVGDPTWADIRAAFEEHSVLVFRGQPLDDETQVLPGHGPTTTIGHRSPRA
jgi:alpha-ketoglutarate-dependent 2,4-dichlorophenoxyacetate dioxygenase